MSNYVGVVDPFNFTQGVYQCGGGLKSTNAGSSCKNYTNCPANVKGFYAKCDCSYSSTNSICGIL